MSGAKPDGAGNGAVGDPSEVYGAAFLFGPLAACWLLAQNERALGSPSRASAILALGACGTVVALVVMSSLATPVPPYVFSAISAGVLGGLSTHLHREKYEVYLAAGGAKRSLWRTLGTCLVALAATAILSVAVAGLRAAAVQPTP